MTWLIDIDNHVQSAPFLAVAIGYEKESDGMHSGLLYADQKSIPMVFHYCWHNLLKNSNVKELADKNYKVVYINLSFEEILPIIAGIRYIHINGKPWYGGLTLCQIPYGLNFTGGAINQSGTFTFNEGTTGVTCVTFILAILKDTVNIDLVNIDDWPIRKADKYVFERTIQAMEESTFVKIPKEHIELNRIFINGRRIRPEEFAASASSLSYPAKFTYCELKGKLILDKLLPKESKLRYHFLAPWYQKLFFKLRKYTKKIIFFAVPNKSQG